MSPSVRQETANLGDTYDLHLPVGDTAWNRGSRGQCAVLPWFQPISDGRSIRVSGGFHPISDLLVALLRSILRQEGAPHSFRGISLQLLAAPPPTSPLSPCELG